jgi:hypothetical protein
MPDMIDKAKAGLLSRHELDEVAARLERREPSGDLHEQLLVIMFGGDARYRRAVEPYLDFQPNLEIARSALETLCTYWHLTADYVDWVVWFGKGVEWDLDWSIAVVRPLALAIAGRHLAYKKSRRLLELLIGVSEDGTEQQINREYAASALLEASGVPPHKAPDQLPLTDERYAAALQAAKARLPSEPDPPPDPIVRPVPDRVELPDYARPYVPREQPPLVRQARAGELSRADLDRIAQELEQQQDFERVREQLLLMLDAGDASYRGAVERYLDFRSDPEVARVALVILCARWGLTRFLLDQLAQFIEGVVWDWAGGQAVVQPAAFALAGAYLARRRSRSLLELVLRVAEDQGEDQGARSEAARALHLAYGGPLDTVPDHLAPGEELFEWALGYARERLQSE